MMTFFSVRPLCTGKRGRGDCGVRAGMPATGFGGVQWRVDAGKPLQSDNSFINAVSHC